MLRHYQHIRESKYVLNLYTCTKGIKKNILYTGGLQSRSRSPLGRVATGLNPHFRITNIKYKVAYKSEFFF